LYVFAIFVFAPVCRDFFGGGWEKECVDNDICYFTPIRSANLLT